MNGLDQLVISLWFLPVMLFIIIPLSVTCLWAAVSLLISSFRREAGQERVPTAMAETTG